MNQEKILTRPNLPEFRLALPLLLQMMEIPVTVKRLFAEDNLESLTESVLDKIDSLNDFLEAARMTISVPRYPAELLSLTEPKYRQLSQIHFPHQIQLSKNLLDLTHLQFVDVGCGNLAGTDGVFYSDNPFKWAPYISSFMAQCGVETFGIDYKLGPSRFGDNYPFFYTNTRLESNKQNLADTFETEFIGHDQVNQPDKSNKIIKGKVGLIYCVNLIGNSPGITDRNLGAELFTIAQNWLVPNGLLTIDYDPRAIPSLGLSTLNYDFRHRTIWQKNPETDKLDLLYPRA